MSGFYCLRQRLEDLPRIGIIAPDADQTILPLAGTLSSVGVIMSLRLGPDLNQPALGTKQLGALRGAARRYPLVGVTFTVGAVVLAGLPPGSLWVSKDEVLAAALHRSTALYATGLAAAAVSAVYSIKAVWFDLSVS